MVGEFTGSLFLRGTEDLVTKGLDEKTQVVIGEIVDGEVWSHTGGWGSERVYRGCTLPYSSAKGSDRTELIKVEAEGFGAGVGRNISFRSENEFEVAQVVVGTELRELFGDVLGGVDAGVVD